MKCTFKPNHCVLKHFERLNTIIVSPQAESYSSYYYVQRPQPYSVHTSSFNNCPLTVFRNGLGSHTGQVDS
jgi:hypothetical protein